VSVIDAGAALPLYTFIGTKYVQTVAKPGPRWPKCKDCPYLEGCTRDVLERDGFAWCEDVIRVDLDPGYKEPGKMRQTARHLGGR